MLKLPLLLLLTLTPPFASPLAAPSPPPLIPVSPSSTDTANDLLSFIRDSPDPYHATATAVRQLKEAGFTELSESSPFDLRPAGKYYYTRDRNLGSSLIAFCVPPSLPPSPSSPYTAGFKIVAAHTDSPCLKLRPVTALTSAGYLQLAVETYGGGLWHTWFDRDLSISGKVVLSSPDGKISQRLVNVNRPILRVPNLAIHLNTAEERVAFKVNKEDHLQPVLSQSVKDVLSSAPSSNSSSPSSSSRHHPLLLSLLATSLSVDPSSILDFDLSLSDYQPPSLTGPSNEFVSAARLDNLASCFMAVRSLSLHSSSPSFPLSNSVSLIALFDHEEVGSTSSVGAGSEMVTSAVSRISAALSPPSVPPTPDSTAAVSRASFCLSVDQAHAVHPNYASKHEKLHRPHLNAGFVVKTNTNQRYATTATTAFVFREICRRTSGVPPPQDFVARNDCGCGSTIGPQLSATTGIRTIDVGAPQLAMHSIREMMGTGDVEVGVRVMEGFFEKFEEVDREMEGGD